MESKVLCFLILASIISTIIFPNLISGGRIEIGVGGKWPWRRFWTSNGGNCENLGISLFNAPGVNAVTAESVQDGDGRCNVCTLYDKRNCGAGASQYLSCGSRQNLMPSLNNPGSFRCDQSCPYNCNK